MIPNTIGVPTTPDSLVGEKLPPLVARFPLRLYLGGHVQLGHLCTVPNLAALVWLNMDTAAAVIEMILSLARQEGYDAALSAARDQFRTAQREELGDER